MLRIHSLNTQLTPFRLGSQGSRALASKRSKGARQSPDQDTPERHEPPDSNSVGSISHTPVFQENCSAPGWSRAPLGSVSPAGSRTLEVMERHGLLVPLLSGWSAGRGTPPSGYPQRGGSRRAEEALVSASLASFRWGCQSLPFIIQPQQLQNFPGCLSCYYG